MKPCDIQHQGWLYILSNTVCHLFIYDHICLLVASILCPILGPLIQQQQQQQPPTTPSTLSQSWSAAQSLPSSLSSSVNLRWALACSASTTAAFCRSSSSTRVSELKSLVLLWKEVACGSRQIPMDRGLLGGEAVGQDSHLSRFESRLSPLRSPILYSDWRLFSFSPLEPYPCQVRSKSSKACGESTRTNNPAEPPPSGIFCGDCRTSLPASPQISMTGP